MSRRILVASLIVAGAVNGCVSGPPVLDTSAEAERSFDGLYPLKNTRADAAWAVEDLDLSGYNKVILQSAGIEYRSAKAGSRSRARSSQTEFALDQKQKSELREIVTEAFATELANSEKFTVVTEPGTDVLLVRGALLDVVSAVPPDPIGRSDIYLREVGEATLVIELRDSLSEAILMRAVDRRAAENAGGQMRISSSASNRQAVKRLAGNWARQLRTRLDSFAAPDAQ
jgi:hypothetical protein